MVRTLKITDAVLSFWVFGLVCLLFLLTSGRVFGNDPLPPPIEKSYQSVMASRTTLPPPCETVIRETPIIPIGTRQYWTGFGEVEWSGTGWRKVEVRTSYAIKNEVQGGNFSPAPFVNQGVVTTQTTNVTTVAPSSTIYRGADQGGPIRTLVRGVGIRGTIKSAFSGCSSGFG